jgi:hypothetical protein
MKIGVNQIAEFKTSDVTIFVRTTATKSDKALVDALAQRALKGQLSGEALHFTRYITDIFVCGWSGVQTESGLDLPFSYAALELLMGENGMKELGKFVARTVDILKS